MLRHAPRGPQTLRNLRVRIRHELKTTTALERMTAGHTDVERQCVDHLPTSLIDVPADRRSADVLASLSRRRHVRRSL